MVVSAIYYHIHSLQCCQEADDTKLIFHPTLPAVSDMTGWQDFKQKLPAVAFNEGCRFTVNFSVYLHSFICD